MKTNFVILSGILAIFISVTSVALETDQDQPATLDADEFDLDFQTGIRTYRGNVVYKQGSIRIFADEIVAYFKNDVLEKAIARGNPATFKQRPENSDTDVVGTALRIEMDDKNQIILLENKAKVTQDSNTITGKKIIYNMITEKVNVKSGPRKPVRVAEVPSNAQTDKLEAALDEARKSLKDSLDKDSVKIEQGSDRPRLVIQPRKKQ